MSSIYKASLGKAGIKWQDYRQDSNKEVMEE